MGLWGLDGRDPHRPRRAGVGSFAGGVATSGGETFKGRTIRPLPLDGDERIAAMEQALAVPKDLETNDDAIRPVACRRVGQLGTGRSPYRHGRRPGVARDGA